MKIREKNPPLKDLINRLEKISFQRQEPVWRSIAKNLNKPKRSGYEVNLFALEKMAKEGKTLVVPGKVLGKGNLKKAVDIAALKFSETAKEKIKKSGGSFLSIEELIAKKLRPRDLVIVG